MSSEYYHTKESVEEYIKLAEDVNGAVIINKLTPYLKEDDSILEIGSGPGTDWEILSKRFNVTGSDFSEEFLIKLRESYPNEKFLKLDATTLDTTQKFECIYSNKVLHHLSDEELIVSINRQYELLNDKGIVCHTFWRGEGTENFKGMFVNYHEKANLKEVFSPQFEILDIDYYVEFEENDSILQIGRKK